MSELLTGSWIRRCEELPFEMLKGRTMAAVGVVDDEIRFLDVNGERFSLAHDQYCCEEVTIEDINGDLQDLVGHPILIAEEATSDNNPKQHELGYQPDSFTWTFYKVATVRGWVDIRWYGTSNGYYSERVSLAPVRP